MKKITLLMLCVMLGLGFSVRAGNLYLVANNGTQWTSTPAGFTNVYMVNLSTCKAGVAASFNEFLADRVLTTPTHTTTVVSGAGNPTWANGDQFWVAAGTYNFNGGFAYSAGFVVYGGFAGTETATSERAKGSNTWSFTNETTLNGSGYTGSATAAIFTAAGDRIGSILDGLTFTACPATIQAVWARATTVRYCKFTSNAYKALNLTIAASGNTAICTDCYFTGNAAAAAGDAACINANPAAGGTINITNCTFESNSSAATGSGSSAGVKTQGAGTTSMSNCIIKNNSASAGSSSAVSTNSITVSVSNCLIYGNNGKSAFYMNGGNVYNCTVAENTTGGVYLASTTNICKIYNTVFWGSSNSGAITSAAANGTSVVNNCAYTSIHVNYTGSTTGNVLLSTTNDSGTNAPYFVDPATFNYQLGIGSSLINAGNGAISGLPVKDMLNVDRPQGSAYDIGAYELSYYNTTVTFNDGGTINSYTSGAVDAQPKGTQLVFTITPASGKKITSVTYNGIDVTSSLVNGVYTAPALATNATLAVQFDTDLGTGVTQTQIGFNCLSANGRVELSGLTPYTEISVYTVTGAKIKLISTKSSNISIALPQGIYMLKAANRVQKVVVK